MGVKSFTLIGSSSGRNAGDAAILSGMMDAIDAAGNQRYLYEIPTFIPNFVYSAYQNRVRGVPMLPPALTAGMFGLPTWNSLNRTDATLIFDNMLFDRDWYNPLFNFMSTMYLMLPIIKKKGKTLGCYNIGAGPVTSDRGRNMLKVIGQTMDFIVVRDQESFDLFRDLGVETPMTITADAALNVASASPERIKEIMVKLGLGDAKEILALNVNAYLNTWAEGSTKPLSKEEFATTYAKAIDEVAEQLGVPLLFVCTQHHDVSITKMVMERMKSKISKTIFSNIEHNHHEVKGVLSKVSLLFAMRLHASILC